MLSAHKELVNRYGHDPVDDYYDEGAIYGSLPQNRMNAQQIENWCSIQRTKMGGKVSDLDYIEPGQAMTIEWKHIKPGMFLIADMHVIYPHQTPCVVVSISDEEFEVRDYFCNNNYFFTMLDFSKFLVF